MQESYRERDNLLTLKVMRLTKPSVKPVLHVTNEPQDLPGDIFALEQVNDIAATKGAEGLTCGELFSLPQSFGSIYLGETFSCYVSILNDSNQVCRDVSLKTDIQTTSQRFQLTATRPKDYLSPDDSVDEVLSYEVKELGAHILICAVNYLSSTAEKLYMRRFYKFQVLKPLEVKTKFYNADIDDVFVEAQVQNITSSVMHIEHVLFEPSQFYNVLSLNNWPKHGNRSNKEETIFCSTYLNPMDTRQYLYRLVPKSVYIRELRSKMSSSIGKLDIVWQTNFGESGRLQTSQLQRTPPTLQEVRLVTLEAPDVVKIEEQFNLKCRLENSGNSKMEVKLILMHPKTDAFLWCGVSGKVRFFSIFFTTATFEAGDKGIGEEVLGPLPPGSYLDIDLYAIAVKLGLISVDGIRILDMNSTKVHEFDNICKVHVSSNNGNLFE